MNCRNCQNYQPRSEDNGLCACPVPFRCSCSGYRPMFVRAEEGAGCDCWREGQQGQQRHEGQEGQQVLVFSCEKVNVVIGEDGGES